MRQIECARNIAESTFLVDEQYTLDRGWQQGREKSGAPFYVCPYHVSEYELTPMPSAVVSAPSQFLRDTEVTDAKPASAPHLSAGPDIDAGPVGDGEAG